MDRDRGHGGDIPPMIWIKEKDDLLRLGDPTQLRLITDEHLAALYPSILASFPAHIVIEPKEESKQVQHLGKWLDALLELETDRQSLLLGLGGGLTTDLTGFLASVYMRGLDFGLVPTSLLAMVDAALGGKTAMNHRLQKNFIGTIRHPKFIVFYLPFLDTLPCREWANGFAEIIKYQLLFHPGGLDILADRGLDYYRINQGAVKMLIDQCVKDKYLIVEQDLHDQGLRRLLNLGHTAGHALETQLQIDHGQAVALGMLFACLISETKLGLRPQVREKLETALSRFQLPVRLDFDPDALMAVLGMDKKRAGEKLNFVLLSEEGQGQICPLSPAEIFDHLKVFRDCYSPSRSARG